MLKGWTASFHLEWLLLLVVRSRCRFSCSSSVSNTVKSGIRDKQLACLTISRTWFIMASSVHEKADIDAEDMPPVEDVPDYDDLIESALDALDVYQARRADMNLHLKKV